MTGKPTPETGTTVAVELAGCEHASGGWDTVYTSPEATNALARLREANPDGARRFDAQRTMDLAARGAGTTVAATTIAVSNLLNNPVARAAF